MPLVKAWMRTTNPTPYINPTNKPTINPMHNIDPKNVPTMNPMHNINPTNIEEGIDINMVERGFKRRGKINRQEQP